MASFGLTVHPVVGEETVLDGVHVDAHHGGVGELGAQVAAEPTEPLVKAPATRLWPARQPARASSPVPAPRHASVLGRHPGGPVFSVL